ncbi:hypothetical protein ACO9S2_04935 [Nitrospira sp. NS4]|uniref:hypothetical protein n=1 Tax=Nitrospira sp. NS4 TaxID=3414498 RepID=UPI003C2D078D
MTSLSIKQTLHESLSVVFRDWHFFASVIFGPVIITSGALMALWGAAASETGRLTTAFALFAFIVVWELASVRLAVCCHRFILLGEQPGSLMHACSWTMRDTWFALYILVIANFAGFIVFLTRLSIAGLSAMLANLSNPLVLVLNVLGLATAFLLPAYINGRLSLILPATAIDRRPVKGWMDWAWSQSAGNEWPLMVLIGIIPFLGLVLVNIITIVLFELATQQSVLLAVLIFGLAWALFFASTAFAVAVLSLSFKHLSPSVSEGNPIPFGTSNTMGVPAV